MNIELARVLYDWTINSKTRFIDSSDEIVKKAEKIGMKFPNPDLAVFETIYCELDVYNRNGAMLPKDVAEKGLDTIIGKQINFEHEGRGHICGFMIDAKLAKDKETGRDIIIVVGILFKSVWRDEFEQVKTYFEKGQLMVSFELWNQEGGVSILEELPDGHKILKKLIAHGCGLLMKEKPACPNAKVYKLMASEQIIAEAEKIINPIFEKDERVVYAELSIEEKCKQCGNCVNKGGNNKMEFEDTEIIELTEDVQLTDEDIQASENEEDAVDAEIVTANHKAEDGDIEEAKKISYKSRQNLKDSDFAVVIKKGDKTIRKYPIQDAAHVRNALARLGQDKAKEGLKKLGVSVESVVNKVKARAKKLGIEAANEEVIVAKLCSKCGQALSEGQEGTLCSACQAIEQMEQEDAKIVIAVNDLEEAGIPADVIKKIKQLTKEGKSTKEAMKQAWKEHKENAAATEKAHLDMMKHCAGCGGVLEDGKEGTMCSVCQTKHDHLHLQEDYTKMTGELAELKTSYDKIQQDYQAINEAQRRLQEEHNTLKAAHEALQKEYAEKSSFYQDWASKEKTLTAAVEEKDKEIAKSKQELDKLNQEIEKAKQTIEDVKPLMTVGSVAPTAEFYKEMQEKVNLKAFGHK